MTNTNKTNKKIETAAAYELGRLAFNNGKVSAPAMDVNCMNMLKNKEVGQGTHILKSWLNGWHSANIAA